jgi:hypothetical protein
MPTPATQRDPSHLPGNYRTRIFVGGSYAQARRPLLDELGESVRQRGFEPVIADDYTVMIPSRDIHDVTLSLLHSCRLGIFELSELSGAMMEIERTVDYGTRCLLLFADPTGRGWRVSRMLSSFVHEHSDRMKLVRYNLAATAVREASRWLDAMKRMAYDAHNL